MTNKRHYALIGRVVFVTIVVTIGIAWTRLSPDDRFHAIIVVLAGTPILASSDTLGSLCRKVVYLGWIVVAFGLFTAITRYEIGWQHYRVVERSNSVESLVIGMSVVLVATIVKRFAAKESAC